MIALIRIVVVLMAVAGAWPALAAKRVALVFSAQKYEFIRPLKNPGRDAALVAEALEKLGFAVTIENDRDLRRMRRALDDFRADRTGAEVALVYFAGHGVEISGENRLLPVNADASSLAALKASTIALDEIRAAAATIAPSVLIVLDACRDDPFGAGAAEGRSAKALGADVRATANPGFGRVGRAENALFAFAAAPGATASDGDGANSPFSAAFASLLATDGLEIRSVLTMVQQQVYEASGGRQLPYVESGLPKLFFAAETGDLPERERLLLAMADVTPDMRAEVERVAGDAGMPLGPLYGALIAADLQSLTADERRARLEDAAAAFVKTRDDLSKFAADDPRVADLRGRAAQALALGAFDEARGLLQSAFTVDDASRRALKANFVDRTLSAANTRAVSAGAALAELDYSAAIAEFESAAALLREIELEALGESDRSRSTWLLAELGDLYTRTGQSAAARRTYEAMRRVAAIHLAALPDALLSRRDAAAASVRLAGAYRDGGRTKDALALYRGAFAVAEALAGEYPQDGDLKRDVAVILEKIGDALFALGDFAAAADMIRRDVAISRELAQNDDSEALRDLALALERLGEAGQAMGETGSALANFTEAIAIKRRIVAKSPGKSDYRRDLGIALSTLADFRLALNDARGALPLIAEANDLFAYLAASDPGNAFIARNLAQSRLHEADARLALGEVGEAIDGFALAIEDFEALAAADPENARVSRDLAGALARLATALRLAGKAPQAQTAIDRSLAINETLRAADPDSADLARDRLLGLERRADILMALGRRDAAEASYGKALALAETLAKSGSAMAERDLSAMLMKIGDFSRAGGVRAVALKNYERALAIRSRLAAVDPDNAARQRDLILAHTRLAETGRNPRANLAAALAIAEALEAAGTLAPADASMPARLREALARYP